MTISPEAVGETIRLILAMVSMALFFGAIGFFWMIT